MRRKYVPILKCKMGEQKALVNLDEDVKVCIKPLIEIPHSSSTTKRPIEEIINSFWSERDYYFYYMVDWYAEYEDINCFISENYTTLCESGYATPVVDLMMIPLISDWGIFEKNGIAIRLRNNEFGYIEDILNSLFSNGKIAREQVDLILDLQYVSAEDLFSSTAVLKAAFSDLDKASEYNSIIIASASFPKHISQIESRKIYRFKRVENDIFGLSLKLANRFNFNYLYSDYGPSDVDANEFVVGMSPNFKIKYTTFDDYLYLKGIPIKRGGLDISNVRELAKILIQSKDYCGENYSWGDKNIYDIANALSVNPGNLTTWVSYAMNHHITFIVNQI